MVVNSLVSHYRDDSAASFRNYKFLGEKAIAQLTDDEFFRRPGPESNSVAIIVKHISGNLRSRWTDFLTTDGEKPDRRRDTEFEMTSETREDLMSAWDASWETLFDAVAGLTVEDFDKTVTIRGEAHSVVGAINRQLTHYAYHIGQIVFLAKHYRAAAWKTLSVPKGRSEQFNEYLADRMEGGASKMTHLTGAFEFSRRADGENDE